MVNKESYLKQFLIPFLKLLVAGLLVTWLIQSGRFDLESLKKISSPFVWFFGVAAFIGVVLLNALRWQLLLNLEKISLSFIQCVRLSLIGIFFNFSMPGGVGGDVVKASYLMRENKAKKWFIGWSILVDRILGMLALLLYSSLTGLYFYSQLNPELQLSFYILSLTLFLGFVTGLMILLLIPKDKIKKLLESHELLKKTLLPLFYFVQKPKLILMPFLISLLSQGVVIGIGAALAIELNMTFPFWMVLLLFPFGFLATILPISPAGIGVGQAAFYYLFERVAGQGEFGVLVITFFQAIQFLVGLLGGLLFVLYKKKEEG